MKYFLMFLLSIGLTHSALCQSFSNTEKSDSIHFLYQVKQIDEFLERFNDDEFSFIRTTYKEQHREAGFGRPQLLKRLFNMENTSWDIDQLNLFLNQILDTVQPLFLHFTDSTWYAYAECRFLYRGKKIQLPLVLHIKNTNPSGVRWVIAGIGNNAALSNFDSSISAERRPVVRKYISPANHSVNFIGLHRAFSDTANLTDYFEPAALETSAGKRFFNMILSGKAKFSSVKSIRYDFFQVDGWIFSVERFNRNSLNNGWLINGLKRVNAGEKQAALDKLLFRM